MLLEADGNEDLGKQSFVGTRESAFSPKYYVIDGQQRLKTFLELLARNGPARPRAPFESKSLNYRFYCDLNFSLKTIEGLDVDRPHFVLPIRREPDETEAYDWQGLKKLIPTEFLLDKRRTREWAGRALNGIGSRRRRALLSRAREFRERIARYSCPVEIIQTRLEANQHANMFRLLNEGGTDLTAFDLMVARLHSDGVNLRDLWEQGRHRWPNLNKFRIDPIYLLKTVVLMRQRDQPHPACKLSQIKRIRKYYPKDFDFKREFERDWWHACRFVDTAIRDLRSDFGVVNSKFLPYTPMIVPMAAVKWSVKDYDQRFKGRIKDRVRRWYWGAIFSKSYEKSTDTVIGEQFGALRDWLVPGARVKIPPVINFNVSRKEIDERVDSVRSTADAVYKAILCMPLTKGATDVWSNEFLGDGANLHDHHIFPRAYLDRIAAREGNSRQGQFINGHKNHPVNRMLITDRTNLEIKDKPPYVYMHRIDKRILEHYFLSREMMAKDSSFRAFYNSRKARIVSYAYRELLN
jgi:hypothetical protein